MVFLERRGFLWGTVTNNLFLIVINISDFIFILLRDIFFIIIVLMFCINLFQYDYNYACTSMAWDPSTGFSTRFSEPLLCVISHWWQSLILLASSLTKRTLFSVSVFTSPVMSGWTNPCSSVEFCWGMSAAGIKTQIQLPFSWPWPLFSV